MRLFPMMHPQRYGHLVRTSWQMAVGRESLGGPASICSDVYEPQTGAVWPSPQGHPWHQTPGFHLPLCLAGIKLLANSGSQANSEAKQRQGTEELGSSLYNESLCAS